MCTRSERASGRRGRERIATDAPRIARRSKHRNILSMRCYGSAPVLSGTSVIIMLIGPSGKDRSFRLRRKLLQMRSEEHTSELQSLMRISYAVFCLKKKNKNKSIFSPEKTYTKYSKYAEYSVDKFTTI